MRKETYVVSYPLSPAEINRQAYYLAKRFFPARCPLPERDYALYSDGQVAMRDLNEKANMTEKSGTVNFLFFYFIRQDVKTVERKLMKYQQRLEAIDNRFLQDRILVYLTGLTGGFWIIPQWRAKRCFCERQGDKPDDLKEILDPKELKRVEAVESYKIGYRYWDDWNRLCYDNRASRFIEQELIKIG